MLIIHILIAISSIVIASLAALRPQRQLLKVSYALGCATIATGTYLLVLHPTHLVPACESGLIYLAIATGLTIIARLRLRALLTQER